MRPAFFTSALVLGLASTIAACSSTSGGGFGGDDDASTPGADGSLAGDDGGTTADGNSGTDGSGTDSSSPDSGGDAAKDECDGKSDGTACGSAATTSDCDLADTCKSGVCSPNHVASGTACGAAPTACTNQGTCDGNGACMGTPKPAGTACGDTATTACTAPDTCNAAGACLPNNMADGTACGSVTATSCDPADTCLTGVCAANVTGDGAFCQDCAAGAGKCGLCATGACPNLCVAPLSTNLTTTFAGGNGLNGNMFDVVSLSDALVIGMNVNASSAGDFEIYSRPGPIAGALTDSTQWNLRRAVAVVGTGNVVVPGPLFIPLVGSATTGLYVTGKTASVSYTDGTAVGATAASDANLTIKEGYGVSYPFGGNFSPRIWNGIARYVLGKSTTYAAGATANGAMFDVKATTTTSIRALSVNLPAGNHNMRIYFHPGTFVGTEGMASKWTQVGTGATVTTSFGADAPTPIPLMTDISIPAGKSYAFYVTTDGTSSLRVTAGTTVGSLATAAGGVEVYEGASVVYPFGTATTATKWNGTVYSGTCP
ncbi:MAG: Tryptophan synthase alpha chain [Myxococcaceae bacterium]|nr:Tryptophan synthase alpha chain [Myxococcaceae bacterium]